MSASTDALNSAVTSLSKAAQTMLAKIADDTVKIDAALKSQQTPEVDAATARIRALADDLNAHLDAVASAGSAVTQDAASGSMRSPVVGAATPVAGPELAGVPATPEGTSAASAGAAGPSSDFIETETSVNKETSSEAPKAASGVGPAAPDAPVGDRKDGTAPVTPAVPADAGTPSTGTDTKVAGKGVSAK